MVQEVDEEHFIMNVLHSNQTSVAILYSEDDYNSEILLKSMEVAKSLIKIPIYKINIKKAKYIVKANKLGKDTPITLIIEDGTIVKKYNSYSNTDLIFQTIRAISEKE